MCSFKKPYSSQKTFYFIVSLLDYIEVLQYFHKNCKTLFQMFTTPTGAAPFHCVEISPVKQTEFPSCPIKSSYPTVKRKLSPTIKHDRTSRRHNNESLYLTAVINLPSKTAVMCRVEHYPRQRLTVDCSHRFTSDLRLTVNNWVNVNNSLQQRASVN